MFGSPASRASAGSFALASRLSLPKTVVQRTGSQPYVGSQWTTVSWNVLWWDDVGAWSSASPTLIKVPYGYSRCRLNLYGLSQLTSTGADEFFAIQLNGVTVAARGNINGSLGGGHNLWNTVFTGWLEGLNAGDSFVGMCYFGTGNSNIGPSGASAPPSMTAEWAK